MGVDVRVDLGVDLWNQPAASLSEEQLLVGDVLLVGQAVLVPAGGLSGQTGPGSFATGGGQTLTGGKSGGGRGGRGAGALRAAEPEEGGSQDEGHASRDPDDDGPGQARAGCRGDGVALGLQVCKSGGQWLPYLKSAFIWDFPSQQRWLCVCSPANTVR